MNTKQNPLLFGKVLAWLCIAERATEGAPRLWSSSGELGHQWRPKSCRWEVAPDTCERINPAPLTIPTHRQTHPFLYGFFFLHCCTGLVCCEDFFRYTFFSIIHDQNNTDNCSQGLLLSPSWASAQRVQEELLACPWVGQWGCHKFALLTCQWKNYVSQVGELQQKFCFKEAEFSH